MKLKAEKTRKPSGSQGQKDHRGVHVKPEPHQTRHVSRHGDYRNRSARVIRKIRREEEIRF